MLGTGWFGAAALLAVMAAWQLGAERIIAMSRHESRQDLALEFGATDIVTERGDDGVATVRELTGGLGAHSVIEGMRWLRAADGIGVVLRKARLPVPSRPCHRQQARPGPAQERLHHGGPDPAAPARPPPTAHRASSGTA